MDPTLLYGLGALLVAVGLAGTVLPVIPGTILVFAGLVVAAWAEHFTRVGWIALAIIAVLAALAFAADFVATLLGARRVGASPLALFGAALGGVVGVFGGLPGMLLGPFLGAFIGEWMARGRLGQAGKVGLGTWLGLVAAAIAKIVLSFAMIAVWVGAYYA